jgi:iron complex transport system ATP-binding protein
MAIGTAVRLEEAVVTIDGRRVLGPVSLEVRRGERWALLGPNGAGKTTLFSLVAAERIPSGGSVTVLGETLGRTDMRRLRARIGLVSHRVADALPWNVAALEVVLTGKGGLLAPWWGTFDEDDRAAAGRLLDTLSCGHLADQPFAHCSQGERQRILVARSLLGGHELLLLDEPTAGVDLPGRESLVGALERLASTPSGPTTVMTAHNLEELPPSLTHAALLRGGRLVAAGPADEVLTDELLSGCFGLPLRLSRHGGRRTAWAVGEADGLAGGGGSG